MPVCAGLCRFVPGCAGLCRVVPVCKQHNKLEFFFSLVQDRFSEKATVKHRVSISFQKVSQVTQFQKECVSAWAEYTFVTFQERFKRRQCYIWNRRCSFGRKPSKSDLRIENREKEEAHSHSNESGYAAEN